jgi:DNA-binding NtrC family response regulator
VKKLGRSAYDLVVLDFKRQILEISLRAHRGNATQAAKSLGIGRPYMARLMRELGARRPV